jgi:glycosyltransferase involved in cell wall biosynthesis
VKVLVNAVSIKEGGPLVVLRNLIEGMHSLRKEINWVVAGPRLRPATPNNGAIEHLDTGSTDRDPFRLLLWYERDLPSAVDRLSPDVVFSMTNYLPLRRLKRPTVLLVQHAGHFSREFESLDGTYPRSLGDRIAWRYKNAWVRRSVRTADMLLVQTRTLAEKIALARLRRPDQIAVVSHGPGQVRQAAARAHLQSGDTWRIGYVSKFGVQKNFETLFRAARRLSDAGRAITIVLTLDPAYKPVAETLNKARMLGVSHLIENRGEVREGVIEELYDSLDIMVFCSLTESFGFPMVESMARGLPIVVADTPENNEITASAGLRFSPFDDGELARQLEMLMRDDVERQRRSERSLSRGNDFSWLRACEETMAILERGARCVA